MGYEEQNECIKLKAVSEEGQPEAAVKQCPVNCKQSQPTSHTCRLPKGLIGTKSTAQVFIKGTQFNCLLDTGSQVTTVPHSFYSSFLSDQEIKPLVDILEVEGANGQSVPYMGYIELDVTFPAEFLGTSIDIHTLALVVPDVQSMQSLVLIGTNTLDVLYERSLEDNLPMNHSLPYGYRAVLKILELRYNHSNHGVIRLHGKNPQTIPPRGTVVLEGTSANCFLQNAVIEHPCSFSLPGSLIVQSCLVDCSKLQHCQLPVIVSNESDHDVIIPARSPIAQMSAINTVIAKEQSASDSVHSSSQPLNFNFGDSPLSPEWRERITAKLSSIPEVFAKHDLDFGKTDKVTHRIKLSDETPFKQRPRPIHPQDVDAVRTHLQELFESGIIRESESPFASPIVVVRKKNGTVRLCIDYRKLNLQTIKDAYALPKLEDAFTALSGSEWFSVLDLKSGYYQIEMEEADKAKTAFVCPLGFWEWNRMPQGVTNAPSTFQRLMEKCMGEMNLKEVLVFIDDLIIFAPTLEEHEARLMKVLNRLKEFGLKLSVEKCMFFQTSVKYLGHVVSRNGVETDPDKIKALTTWPVPKTLKELRSYLGFAGYYRRYIKGYSAIVKPLHDLTSGYPPSQKKFRATVKPEQYLNPKEPFADRWTPACQEAYDTVIQKLTTAPVLAFADPQKPYLLHTDASSIGLGAVLYQEQEGQNRVIAYASRGLSRSESRYPAHKLEFLALKWAVTEKFSDYLYGNDFTVVTDSNPLTYLLTTAKLDAASYRWLASLSTYSFKILYRAGKQAADADGLSRRPHGDLLDDFKSQKERERILKFWEHHLPESELISLDQPTVQAICDRQLVYSSDSHTHTQTLVQSLSMSITALPDSFTNDQQFGSSVIPQLTETEIAAKQRTDPVIQHVITQLESGVTPPPTLRDELPDLPLLLRELNRLELRNNVLVRKRQIGSQCSFQLVLPQELRNQVLIGLHDHMGHMGMDRTLDLVRTRFYWPRMSADVCTKIKTCERCVKRKSLPEKAAPLVNIKTTRPLELVCMDFLSLEPDGRIKDILVMTDHFTKYAVAIPTTNQKAKTVAKCLWDNFLIHYGIPEKLHSDQGPDFESRTIKELCKVTGIHKIRTTPYHPRGNPVERFNRTLLNMLGTLTEQDKSHWKDFVKPLVHAYNCTRNDVTGFTPYELMFGRQPRLPIDLAFGLPVTDNQTTSHSQYVQDLKSHLEESYKIATGNAEKVMQRNKARFDKHVTASELSVGDRVLVRNVRLRGKHKLADKWESDVYIVVKRAGTLPVYTVRPENKDKPSRTLHRDLLLPCGYLPAPVTSQPKKQPLRPKPLPTSDNPTNTDDLSDEEETIPSRWYNSEPPKFTTVIHVPNPSLMVPTPMETTPSISSDAVAEDATLNLSDLPDSNSDANENPESSYLPDTVETPESSYLPDPLPETSDSPDDPETQGNLPLPDDSETQGNLPLPGTPEQSSDSDQEDVTQSWFPYRESMEVPPTSDSSTSDTSDDLPVVRRSSRASKPPDRLHYSKPGQSDAAQSLFHGLTTALSYALAGPGVPKCAQCSM